MNKTDDEIISKIKSVMVEDNPSVGINWVLKNHFETDDRNKADQIAWKMLANREYILNTNAHSKDDVFIVKNPNYQKELLDLANAKNISKTYWLTFTMAVIALLISLVLLIVKLRGE